MGYGWLYRELERTKGQGQRQAPPETPPQLPPFPLPAQPAVIYVAVPMPMPFPFAPQPFAPLPPLYPQAPEEELAMLESYRDMLARELEHIEERIKELKQQLGKGAEQR